MRLGSTYRVLAYVFLIALFFVVSTVISMVTEVDYHAEEDYIRAAAPQVELENPSHVKPASLKIEATEKDEAIEEVSQSSTESDETVELMEANAPEVFFEELLKSYEQDVLANLPAHKSRNDITIRYYHHAPDGSSAYSLQRLGYYIHERPVEPGYEAFQSNAIFYGDSVAIEDVQIVAYTLLEEGLPIKTIKKSRFSSDWKARSIEIGADSTLVSKPTLSLEDVKNLTL